MNIPFVDLSIQYQNIKSSIDEAISKVINNTAFVFGAYLKEFEKQFSEKYGVKHCIGVANGTDAIFITLKCLGIGVGDEVIVPAHSWISTSEAVSLCGATPIFIDIEPEFYTIDPNLLEKKITSKTKAVLPVHLFGLSVDMDPIIEICNRNNILIIEDCAQAHFAEYNNKKAGTFGIAGTFSFYPGKNLGAYGDAGAIVTNDDELAKKIRMFANHGSFGAEVHRFEGMNSRLDGLQAAILSVKLPYIDEWNNKRLDNAKIYNEALKDIVQTPQIRENSKHVFHCYVIRTKQRDELNSYLNHYGINTHIHYPTALPFLEAYKHFNHKTEDFPIACQYQKEFLSLPIYPELTKEQLQYIIDKIRQFFQ